MRRKKPISQCPDLDTCNHSRSGQYKWQSKHGTFYSIYRIVLNIHQVSTTTYVVHSKLLKPLHFEVPLFISCLVR
jgi:hypothetical protein